MRVHLASWLPSSLSRRWRMRVSSNAAVGRRSGLAFYGRSFLVIVPGFNHKEWKGIGAVIILPVQTHGFIQRFSAVSLNVTVKSPLGRRVVKAGPGAPDRDFIGMLVLHDVVKILKILLAPIAAVRRPSSGPGLNPGVRSGKVVGKLRCRLVFVDEQRRPVPAAAVRKHAVPVDVAALGENKYHRPPIKGEIGVAILRGRTDVRGISLIHGSDRTVGRLGVLVFRLVVQECDLKVAFAGCSLQQPEIVIGIRPGLAVPVDYKRGDSHATSLLNLLAENSGILAGIAHIHVGVVSKPGHVNREKFRRESRRQSVLNQNAMNAAGCAPARNHKKTQTKSK